MKEVTWKDRLHYKFDNYMAKGTAALIAGLGVLSLIVIIIAGIIISIGGTALAPEGSSEGMTF
jgi:ion channel POLLUX/CASTOR